MLKLFISYASEDYEIARRLYDDLRRPGIDPWLDDELRPGGQWNNAIVDQIKDCSHFVALISPHSLHDDRFVQREWDQALSQDKYFMPVRLEECNIPESMNDKQWEDLFPYEIGIARLLRFFHEEKRSGLFEETFSCNGTDNVDWALDGWELDPFDHTGRLSQSLHGSASLSPGALLPQTVIRSACIELHAGGATSLSYFRRLTLSAFLGEASFGVSINDGTDRVLDEETNDINQGGWEQRRVQLPALTSDRVTLKLFVKAHSRMNYMSRAEAWIDDIEIL